MGKLLLGQRPDLLAHLNDKHLQAEIETARHTGCAWNREETEAGIVALAAWAEPPSPLSAMISVSWPVFRFIERKAKQALRAIAASGG